MGEGDRHQICMLFVCLWGVHTRCHRSGLY